MALPVFKTVRASAIPAPVGSTPMRPRHTPATAMFTEEIAGTVVNLRAAAVCMREDRVLICRTAGLDFWYLPGGRVNVGETTSEALFRELTEEIGSQPADHRLIWIVESFYSFRDQPYHEIAFYYAARLSSSAESFAWDSPELRIEGGDGQELEWTWVSRNDFPHLDLRPPFLRERLAKPQPESIEHFVTNH